MDDLLYMREEEKLARDVYITLYEKWGIPVFNNISNRESDHNDLIQAYEKLMKGSESHLRAFVAQIESRGEVYTAQRMSQADVDEILN